jgi:hypothetical protein
MDENHLPVFVGWENMSEDMYRVGWLAILPGIDDVFCDDRKQVNHPIYWRSRHQRNSGEEACLSCVCRQGKHSALPQAVRGPKTVDCFWSHRDVRQYGCI